MLVISSLGTVLHAGGDKMIAPATTPVEVVDPSSWYLGAGLVRATFSACNRGCTYEDITYGVMIRGGYDFNDYFGIEARFIYTFLGEGPFGGAPLMHAGVFLKPQFPLGERINLYGLLGYGYTKNLGNGARLRYFDDGWGFSAGIGMEYRLSEKKRATDTEHTSNGEWRLFIEYQKLLFKSNEPDMSILSFGARRTF